MSNYVAVPRDALASLLQVLATTEGPLTGKTRLAVLRLEGALGGAHEWALRAPHNDGGDADAG